MKAPDPIEVPISIITGFLGSGKTTLINHLVSQEAMEATALIINEFGCKPPKFNIYASTLFLFR